MRRLYFNLEDASQIMIGAFALGVPVIFSEEAWRLGSTLPMLNLSVVFVISIVFIAFFTYQSVFQANIQHRVDVYFARIAIAYGITILVVSLLLFALNKFPLLSDPLVALKRLIVVSMPASMGAIIVDSFDKE